MLPKNESSQQLIIKITKIIEGQTRMSMSEYENLR